MKTDNQTFAQHTPGPWIVRTNNDGFEIWHEPGDEFRSRIAGRVHDFDLCPEHGGSPFANASLISAAPDLLAELIIAADLLMGVACQPADTLNETLREKLRATALSAYAVLACAREGQS